MNKKELDKLKWLWNETSDSDILDKVADAICNSGDTETLVWLWNETSDSDILDKVADAICRTGDFESMKYIYSESNDPDILKKVNNAITNIVGKPEQVFTNSKSSIRTTDSFENDFFICHASEDKDSCVRELATKLQRKGYNVWYDEFTLTLGDSLRRKIDQGLSGSRFGIVVLSKYFFEKEWPQTELDGLVAKEQDGSKTILPIWHGVTKEDVLKFSPILAGRLAISTNKGLDNVVREIIRAIK